MHIKFLLLTNAVFTLATHIPWARNHRFDEEDEQSLLNGKNDSKPIIEMTKEQLPAKKINENEMIVDKNEKLKNIENIDPWNLSEDTDRIQFQIEGHEGPQTYMFGFDAGHGKNRQFRLEERHRDGTVKGQYGYYDAKGKLRRVRYVAKPFEGYTEIHHESDIRKEEK